MDKVKKFARFGTIAVFLFSLPLFADSPQGHIIQFGSNFYDPDELTVAVGDTIIWQGSFSAHPLQSTSIPDGADSWGPINTGTEFRYVVDVEGTYQYHCTLHSGVGMTGSFTATTTSIDNNENGLPSSVQLEQNYPNPFNPATEIRFALPERTEVSLEVFTIHGQKIATLIDEVREAGYHSVTFHGSALPSGVYMYRLQTAQSNITKRMVYIK